MTVYQHASPKVRFLCGGSGRFVPCAHFYFVLRRSAALLALRLDIELSVCIANKLESWF